MSEYSFKENEYLVVGWAQGLMDKYGYDYGGKEVALDLAWYQKYKPSVDGIVSGFMWLGYLWMLFTKAPDILNGMGLRNEAVPPMPNLEYINPLRLNGRASKRRRE